MLCALAANSNEAALTQLVGRILRQPHATTTGVAALDECYVYAHRADTKATVEAIRKGLEGDGLGDLAADVILSGGRGAPGEGQRKIGRRHAFRTTAVALPQVVTVEGDGNARTFDAETDLFPSIDWSAVDLGPLAKRLPKARLGADHRMIRLAAGDAGLELVGEAAPIAVNATFDNAYAVRTIADLVPNGFVAFALVADLLAKLRLLGWDDAAIGPLASFLVDELRKELAAERERQAVELFAAGLHAGSIQFALRGDCHDWIAPLELPTSQPANADQLTNATGAGLERSLFLPIYRADLNGEEREVAIYSGLTPTFGTLDFVRR